MKRAGMAVYLASGGTDYPYQPQVQTVADALVGRAGPLSALAGALTAIASAGGTETLLMPVDRYLGYARDVARCAWGAALIIYDMCKALSHDVTIEHIRLQGKSGGKRDFHRETGEQP